MKAETWKNAIFSAFVCLVLVCVLLPAAAMAAGNTCSTHGVAYNNGFCPNDPSCYEPCGGSGTVEDPFTISNAGQLYWFAAKVNAGESYINGKLTANIVDNTGDVAGCDGTKAEGWRDWTPIGIRNGYQGTFDGSNFTVSGLYFNGSGYAGLFAAVNTVLDTVGTVQNVGVVNSYIKGNNEVGGVVGHIEGGSITGCYNAGTVSGHNVVGGVVGNNVEGTIENCYNTGTISGENYIGGVVGANYSSIENCYNTGTISGENYIGGVVGANHSSIENCYNTGTISGENYIGGVAGENNASITNCYNTGAVSGSSIVGGVAGNNYQGNVTNCYNTGAVTGSGSAVGGVVGANNGTVEKCYYLADSETEDGGKTNAQFASGEVAYLLQSGVTAPEGETEIPEIWGQDITTGENDTQTDNYPVLGEPKVYYGFTTCHSDQTQQIFTNNSNAAVEKPAHTTGTATDNGDGTHDQVCSVCGILIVNNATHSFDEGTHQCVCGKVEQFTITFNTDGGSEIAPITLDYGAAVTAPADPAKTGYTFAGWDKEIPSTMPAENMTVTAEWTINHYTITFVDTGDNTYDPITLVYGAAVTVPANPTKTGYTFASWDKEIPETMPAENMTLTARWTPIAAEAPSVTVNGSCDTNHQAEHLLSVAATEKSDYSYSYQWYSNPTESNQGGTAISGATESTYAINTCAAEAGRMYYFYCVVTATRKDNGQTASTASDVVSVHFYSSPTAKELTYNGADQALVNAGVTDASRPMEYVLAEAESDVPENGWNREIPTGRDAGTYYVCYRVVGKGDTEGLVEVEIKAKPVTIKADSKSAYVNGSEPTYTYTVIDLYEGHTIRGVVVSCASADLTMAGTYEITVSLEGLTVLDGETDVTENYAITTANGTLTVSTPYVPPYIPPVIPTPEPEKPVTIPVTDKETSVEIEVTISEGKATVENVDPDELEKVVDGDSNTVTIDFSELDGKITEVELPPEVVEKIAETAGESEQTLEIVLSDGMSIEFNASSLNEQIQKTEGTNLSVSVLPGKDAELTKEQTTAVGDRPAYDINVISNGKHISNMGGKITVSAPYELKNGEKAGGLVVYYVDDNGNRERCETRYDEQTKLVSWETDHLSLYMIDYDETLAEVCDRGENCPLNDFTDTDPGEWYHDGIHYCVENDLIIGLTDDLFGADGTATRAQIVTILWRLEGKPVVNYLMTFDDVDADMWYTEAVRWAASEGIVYGYGDSFGVNDPITREQLAAILYRYEQRNGGGFKGMWMFLLDYNDRAEISEWAYEAMCWMTMNDVISGKPGNILDPKGNATRAELAVMLQKYCSVMSVE